MSDKTGISWCDSTFNPWCGCQKVSPACDNCYAERDAHRFAPGRVLWGVGSERRTFGDAHWRQPLKWARRPYFECSSCGWRGAANPCAMLCEACGEDDLRPARRRVFCASMGDWLDLDAPLDEFVRLLDTIRLTPELDWLLLSKRIGNWRKRLTDALAAIGTTDEAPGFWEWVRAWLDGSPPANVWLGATVIDQTEADRDIPKLLSVPARVRFVSIEPMLGAVDLTAVRNDGWSVNALRGDYARHHDACLDHPAAIEEYAGGPRVHWVIAGGESGPHARPMHPEWVRSLSQQCGAAGVAFFLKQMGGHPDKRDDISTFPPDLRRQEFPHAA